MIIEKWINGKLLPFDIVFKNGGVGTSKRERGSGYIIYNTKSKNYLSVKYKESFGKEITVYLKESFSSRKCYVDKNGIWYYDECFEWIGQPKDWIPEELWEI